MKVLVVSEGEHELGAVAGEGALVALARRLLSRHAEFERRTVRDRAVRVHLQPGKSDGYETRAVACRSQVQRQSDPETTITPKEICRQLREGSPDRNSRPRSSTPRSPRSQTCNYSKAAVTEASVHSLRVYERCDQQPPAS